MVINIPMFNGLALRMTDERDDKKDYATSDLQKGLLLIRNGENLAEEAIGFGVPVLKRGLQTIFPGNVTLTLSQTDRKWRVAALFTLNLEERIFRPGSEGVQSPFIYFVKNSLAAVIRGFPLSRMWLTSISNLLRRSFNLKTMYKTSEYCAKIKIICTVDSEKGIAHFEMDTTALEDDKISEIIVMNEQGSHFFDQYHDSSGILLKGGRIGCWDKVTGEKASFADANHKVQFTLSQIEGAKLFRGREQIGSRLAWAGFGYSFPPGMKHLFYDIKIETVP